MDLCKGNVSKTLFKFALPIIALQILNQAYSLVDSIIVSRYAGGNDFAILSNISTLTLLGYCLVQGGAAVNNVVFANLFGAKKYKDINDAKKTFNITILIYTSLIALLYSVFSKELLELIKIPNELINEAILVLIVYALNFIPVGIIVVSEGIMTGHGDSKTPMYLSIIFQLLNLILDYIVVAKLNYGVLGAALASLLASSLSAICMFYKGHIVVKELSNKKANFSFSWLKQSLKLAIPSTISQSVSSLGSFIMQTIVNAYGIAVINGYNVAFTLNNVIICPILGITLAYESFGAQNIGANQKERVSLGFKKIIVYGIFLNILASILTFVLKDLCIGLYVTDKTSETYLYASTLFIILVGNYFALYFKSCFDSYFKAYQKTSYIAIISTITLLIRIVISFMFTPTYGPIFLPYACIISNIVGIIIYLPLYFKEKRFNIAVLK